MKRYNWGFDIYEVPDDWRPIDGPGLHVAADWADDVPGTIPTVLGWIVPDGNFVSPDKAPQYNVTKVAERVKPPKIIDVPAVLKAIKPELIEMEVENPRVWDSDRNSRLIDLERQLNEYREYARHLEKKVFPELHPPGNPSTIQEFEARVGVILAAKEMIANKSKYDKIIGCFNALEDAVMELLKVE